MQSLVSFVMAHQVLMAAVAVDLINLALEAIPSIKANSILDGLLNAVLAGLQSVKNAVSPAK